MIEHLRIQGFKNLFIGANASGKSNLFEVLRVFQGIALGYRIDEIFDGKPKSARGDAWEPIRGGLANAGFFSRDLIFFVPFLTQHGDPRRYGGGRDILMKQAVANYDGILRRCPELKALQDRVYAFLQSLATLS